MIIENELLERVQELTLGDYKYYHTKNEENVLVITDSILDMIEDLIIEVDHWKEKYEDLEQQVNNDFEPEIEIPDIHGKNISY